MAAKRAYREDLERVWTEEPLVPGSSHEKELERRFESYLSSQGVDNAHRLARELWRIMRLYP